MPGTAIASYRDYIELTNQKALPVYKPLQRASNQTLVKYLYHVG